MSHLYRHPPKTGNYWRAWRQDGKLRRKALKDKNGNTTKDRATAKYLLAQLDQELAQGKNILPNQDNLVSPVFEAYKEFKAGQRSADHQQSVCARIQGYLTWSKIITFRQINEDTLQKYLNYRSNPPQEEEDKKKLPPIGPVTLNRTVRDIRELLHYALRRDIIAQDPLRDFKKIKEERNFRKIWTKEELTRFIKEANNPEHYADKVPTLYPMVMTGAFSGMRPGELNKLGWQNCYFKEGEFRVVNKPNFKVKTLKERIIPMHPIVKKILLKLKAKSKSTYCFDTTNLSRLIKRVLKAAGLYKKGIGLNLLRHSFASHYIMDTGDVKGAQEMLGHEDIQTTMIYTHTLKEHLKRKMKNFNPLANLK